MYNCSGLALRFIVSNKLEISAGFPEEGENDNGAEVTLSSDANDLALLVLAEATIGAANSVVNPPLSIFRRPASCDLWLFESVGIRL